MALRMQVVSTGYLGAPGYNTFYSTGSSLAAAEELAGAVSDYFTALQDNFSSTTAYSFFGEVEAFNPASGQTTGIEVVDTWVRNGTGGTDELPGGTALVVQYRTGIYLNGREVRGRHYLSGLGAIADGDGEVVSSALTDIATAGAILIAAEGGVYSPTNGIVAQIVAVTGWNRFGLIRSRRD